MMVLIAFQVHRIDFDDENSVINRITFVHSDGELWHISASNMSQNVIATVYNHSMFYYHQYMNMLKLRFMLCYHQHL